MSKGSSQWSVVSSQNKNRSVFPYLPLFPQFPLLPLFPLLSLLLLSLTACTSQSQTPQLTFTETYPVEEARADLHWTVLERSYPSGRIEHIFIPSSWTPLNLSDYDNLSVHIERHADESRLVIRRK